MIFPFRRPPGIPERIIPTNNEPGIVAPFLGIADADTQSFELGFGLRFRRRCHPAERVDPMVEPNEKIFDHLPTRADKPLIAPGCYMMNIGCFSRPAALR